MPFQSLGMGLFSRFFQRPIGVPHRIHPGDEDLVGENDIAWFSSLTETDIRSVGQQDDVFKAAT